MSAEVLPIPEKKPKKDMQRRATRVQWLFTPNPPDTTPAGSTEDVPADALQIIEKIDAVHVAKEENWRHLEQRIHDPEASNELIQEFGSLHGAKERVQALVVDLVLRVNEARDFLHTLLEEDHEPSHKKAIETFLSKINTVYDELVQKKEAMLTEQLAQMTARLAAERSRNPVNLDIIDTIETSYRKNLERIELIKFTLEPMAPNDAPTRALARSLYELFQETIFKLMHLRDLLLTRAQQTKETGGRRLLELEVRQLEIKEHYLFAEAEDLRNTYNIILPDIGSDKTIGFPTIDVAA